MFQSIGEMVMLLLQVLQALPRLWRERHKVFEQLFEIGNASLLMACLLSLFIGGVIALQSGPLLAERGLTNVVGAMVGVAMAKELGPVMMAVLIAGRIGSAMAAEIGSMRVYQELDALRTMNISTVHYLVMPRVVAISIALPMLVLFSILIGWVGGALVCMANDRIGLKWDGFFSSMRDVLEFKHVLHGVVKAFAFAVTIGVVSCTQGLQTIGGPRGIGRSVTKAVVNSIVLILLLDYFVTRFLMYFES
jgi:phospholipid/cholesterol/gamma-HCH transport system permease protein